MRKFYASLIFSLAFLLTIPVVAYSRPVVAYSRFLPHVYLVSEEVYISEQVDAVQIENEEQDIISEELEFVDTPVVVNLPRITSGIDNHVFIDIYSMEHILSNLVQRFDASQFQQFLDYVQFNGIVPFPQTTFESVHVVNGVASRETDVRVFVFNEQQRAFLSNVATVGRSGVFSLDIPLAHGENILIFVFTLESQQSALVASIYRSSEDILENLLIFSPRLPGIN